jgi:GDPmannose 4,6-dehydratase
LTRRALIVGITGQDGSFLTELLLSKGYHGYGVIRRSSSFNTGRIDRLYQDPHEPNPRLHLVYGDLTDASSLNKILRDVGPREIYNLGWRAGVDFATGLRETIAYFRDHARDHDARVADARG